MKDIEDRKALFDAFACSKLYAVNADGIVLSCIEINIEYVDIDKNGRVYVEWRRRAYDRLDDAEVDVVRNAEPDRIEGVFTSEYKAVETAKAWFHDKKKEKIAELEQELAKLKTELYDYECKYGCNEEDKT